MSLIAFHRRFVSFNCDPGMKPDDPITLSVTDAKDTRNVVYIDPDDVVAILPITGDPDSTELKHRFNPISTRIAHPPMIVRHRLETRDRQIEEALKTKSAK